VLAFPGTSGRFWPHRPGEPVIAQRESLHLASSASCAGPATGSRSRTSGARVVEDLCSSGSATWYGSRRKPRSAATLRGRRGSRRWAPGADAPPVRDVPDSRRQLKIRDPVARGPRRTRGGDAGRASSTVGAIVSPAGGEGGGAEHGAAPARPHLSSGGPWAPLSRGAAHPPDARGGGAPLNAASRRSFTFRAAPILLREGAGGAQVPTVLHGHFVPGPEVTVEGGRGSGHGLVPRLGEIKTGR
jgi:hypothetical protein